MAKAKRKLKENQETNLTSMLIQFPEQKLQQKKIVKMIY
jgi:hypothetical protein